jgi:hypothetical protein
MHNFRYLVQLSDSSAPGIGTFGISSDPNPRSKYSFNWSDLLNNNNNIPIY